MKIFDLRDSHGRAYAFEVSNLFLGRGAACRIAGSIPGVRILRAHRPWQWRAPDEFCEFELGAVRFQISEPYGDSNRFWIGPVPTRPTPELEVVRRAFARAGVLANVIAPAG